MMTVYVVHSEFNRGYDTEGGATVESVHSTLEGARAARVMLCDSYRATMPVCGEPGDGDSGDWGVDVAISEMTVDAL